MLAHRNPNNSPYHFHAVTYHNSILDRPTQCACASTIPIHMQFNATHTLCPYGKSPMRVVFRRHVIAWTENIFIYAFIKYQQTDYFQCYPAWQHVHLRTPHTLPVEYFLPRLAPHITGIHTWSRVQNCTWYYTSELI